LSEAFLRKRWPRNELNALFAIEGPERARILPVWHGISQPVLSQISPLLADRVAATTSEGIASVAREITARVFGDNSQAPSKTHPSRLRRLVELLESASDLEMIAEFLRYSPDLFVLSYDDEDDELLWKPGVGGVIFDLAHVHRLPSDDFCIWTLVLLRSPVDYVIDDAGEPSQSVSAAVSDILTARNTIRAEYGIVQNAMYDLGLNPYFSTTIYAGRRSTFSELQRNRLREYKQQLFGDRISLRTYDALVDNAH
jgi:hypothetical protein